MARIARTRVQITLVAISCVPLTMVKHGPRLTRRGLTNAGEDPAIVLKRVLDAKGGFGFNAATGEYGDAELAQVPEPEVGGME